MAIMSKLLCLPSRKGSALEGKSKFFTVEAISKGACFAGKQIGSQKSSLP